MTTAWLASYPKSGNTWLRALMSALSTGEVTLQYLPGSLGNESVDDALAMSLSGLDAKEALQVMRRSWTLGTATFGAYRVRKTHEPWARGVDGWPTRWQPKGARAVYLVRDPRDVVLSWAHHNGQSPAEAAEFLAHGTDHLMAHGHEVHAGWRAVSWSRHVLSWTVDCPLPVLTLRYEDLLIDPHPQVEQLAAWLDIEIDEERIARAIAACDFRELAAREAVEGFSEAAAPDRVFFRRGRSGTWRSELDPELARAIERDHGEVMESLGYL